jgi:predicted metal-dependent hydrolase
MRTAFPLTYLGGYPPTLLEQVQSLVVENRLGDWLTERFPHPPRITTNTALHEYVMDLKDAHLKTAPPLRKVSFDDRIATLQRALGQHRSVTVVQGKNLKSRNEIVIASLLKETPPEFLRMVVVHELVHLRESNHDKAFYQFCCRIEPKYHDYELGLRLYLTHREMTKNATRA